MSLTLSADELLAYTNEERAKWEHWFREHPASTLEAPVQRQGTFTTAWDLIDHIFLVEKRHIERLTAGEAVSQSTGVLPPDRVALFDFARATRAELAAFVAAMEPGDAAQHRTFRVRDGVYTMTPRKLLFHILLHETRHWAQIATAMRNAGFAPPGHHDLFYSSALE